MLTSEKLFILIFLNKDRKKYPHLASANEDIFFISYIFLV